MDSTKRQARVAGLLYLLVAVTAPIGLVYVPGKLFVGSDPAVMAEQIRASEGWVRAAIASELFHQAVEVFLVLALYELFKPVSKSLTRQLAILGLIPIPIMFLNVLSEIAALMLASDTGFLGAFDRGQLNALAALCIRLHGQGIHIAAVFWGLWLYPFGMLVMRCGFIPKGLGVLLIVAGLGYTIGSFTTLVLPRYIDDVSSVTGILELGELPIIFWLAIWGATGSSLPRRQ